MNTKFKNILEHCRLEGYRNRLGSNIYSMLGTSWLILFNSNIELQMLILYSIYNILGDHSN